MSAEDARESDGALLGRMGTDAVLWAQEMVKREPFTDLDPTPGDLLHVWLCNAIEAGRAAGYSSAKRETNPNWPLG